MDPKDKVCRHEGDERLTQALIISQKIFKYVIVFCFSWKWRIAPVELVG